jgi:hypothetical protein
MSIYIDARHIGVSLRETLEAAPYELLKMT